jgi:hypothetical protein
MREGKGEEGWALVKNLPWQDFMDALQAICDQAALANKIAKVLTRAAKAGDEEAKLLIAAALSQSEAA